MMESPGTNDIGNYTRETLQQGEVPLYRAKYHPMRLIVPFCIGFPFLLFSFVGLLGTLFDPSVRGGAGVAFVFMAIFGWFFYALPALRFWKDEVVITDKRVIIKLGIIARTTRELFFSKIESTGVAQGILGRMLNYGTVNIRGTGGTSQLCKFVRDPLKFRGIVQQMQEKVA